jgi:YebC/PmpR family DNA-binding regulatory protein
MQLKLPCVEGLRRRAGRIWRQPMRSCRVVGVELDARTLSSACPSSSAAHTLLAVSGHSKWASIKHKKAIVDSRRGVQFTKLARAITVAARDGGGDPDSNATLENAVAKARAASMPKDNIERAIARGTGEGGDADAIQTVLYEGYGPGGVALLVQALTDNRNRTGADVRNLFSKHGGSLGEPGSVAYLFEKKGTIVIDASRYSEEDLMVAVEAGAEDVSTDEGVFEVITEPASFTAVRAALEARGVELQSAEVAYRPSSLVAVEEAQAIKLLKLIDALEENDDVGEVHANFDVPAEVLERVAG